MSELGPAKQLMTFLVAKVGLRDAVKIATFLVQWGAVDRALRHAPSPEEYCVHWKVSAATYYRELARFRKVWPDEASPQKKWQWVESKVKLPRKLDDNAVVLLLQSPLRP